MSDGYFNIDEFMKNKEEAPVARAPREAEAAAGGSELDIQKVVVEELAADKAVLHEQIAKNEAELAAKKAEIEEKEKALSGLEADVASLRGRLSEKETEAESLSRKLQEASARVAELERKLSEKMESEWSEQERNPNALALLDREVELPDRFPGETRDHVIEVVREARDKAEAEGRCRRAQLLEGVLRANESTGNLAAKRAEMEKFFSQNGNIINGAVIAELDRYGIPYKEGEKYFLAKEIIRRNY